MASLYRSRFRQFAGSPAHFTPLITVVMTLVAAGGLAGCGRSRPARPDVLLVVLSGTRVDHTSVGGYRHDTTPSLLSIAASGTVFENAVTNAPWGLSAQASILTGRYLSEHAAVFDHALLEESLETLAEKLRASGYVTAGVVTDPALGSGNGFSQGFDNFMGIDPQQEDSPDDGAAAAEAKIIEWFKSRGGSAADKPLFAWLVLTNARLPFSPPSEYQQKFIETPIELPRLERLSQLWIPFARKYTLGMESLPPEEMVALKALYDGELAYADYRLGRVFDALKKAGTFDDTLIVVTADSGEDLGDHDSLADASSLYDSIVRVPLVMRLPGRVPAGRRESAQVQTTDIFQAIVALSTPSSGTGELQPSAIMPPRPEAILEAPADPTALRAYQSLDPAMDLSPFLRNLIAVRTPQAKFIVTSQNKAALFDLAADPTENRSALAEQQELGKRLSAVIGQWAATLRPPAWSPRAQAAPPEGSSGVPASPPASSATGRQ